MENIHSIKSTKLVKTVRVCEIAVAILELWGETLATPWKKKNGNYSEEILDNIIESLKWLRLELYLLITF